MDIIYPPLVEQSFEFYQNSEGKNISRSELYRIMVENRIIHENGSPTDEAIKNGFVKDFYEAYDLTFNEFLVLYPVFKNYAPELFEKIDGFWEIPVSLKEELVVQLQIREYSYDEKKQIKAFLEDR